MTKKEVIEYLMDNRIINNFNYKKVDEIIKMEKPLDETVNMLESALQLNKPIKEMIKKDKEEKIKKEKIKVQKTITEINQEKIDGFYNEYYHRKTTNPNFKYTNITIMSVPNPQEKIVTVYYGLTDENSQYIKENFNQINVNQTDGIYNKIIPTDLLNEKAENMEVSNIENSNICNLFRTYESGAKVINTNIDEKEAKIIIESQGIQNSTISKSTKVYVKSNGKNINSDEKETTKSISNAFVDSILLAFLSGIAGGIILAIMLHFIK